MFSEWLLGVWSALGLFWWVTAWRLVARERAVSSKEEPPQKTREMLSIFKPLPPLGADGWSCYEAGLESFLCQLDGRSEMLLGVHEEDRVRVAPFLEPLLKASSPDRLRVVYRTQSDGCPNPKIAWQKILSVHARGELWLWSDADMVAPPGFLDACRREFSQGVGAMLTFPYVVREVPSTPAFLDALYVNVEFFPGVLFLRQRGEVDFGLGAGMLFRRDDFLKKVDWRELGAALADDFILGQKLGPVRISRSILTTSVSAAGWLAALLHYLRWSKTVWWNRPMGSALRITVMPVPGWLVYALVHPGRFEAWAGLFVFLQADTFFAGAICRLAGCRLRWRDVLTLEAWALGRVGVWIVCWLPWPVVWRGRRWWRPQMPLAQFDT